MKVKVFIVFVALLAGMFMQTSPAMADSGTITINGMVPLTAYNVAVSGITASKANISWQTNGNSSSQVFYDTTSHVNISDYAYHSTLDNTLISTHNVQLSALSGATTYHYMVESVATINGNILTAISADNTFTTVSIAPTVTTAGSYKYGNFCYLSGSVTDMGTASTVAVYFQYGRSTSYGSVSSSQNLSSPQGFNELIGPLSSGTYHFRAVAVGDGTSYGQDMAFSIGH